MVGQVVAELFAFFGESVLQKLKKIFFVYFGEGVSVYICNGQDGRVNRRHRIKIISWYSRYIVRVAINFYRQ